MTEPPNNTVVNQDTGRAGIIVLCYGLGKLRYKRRESVLRTHKFNMARESEKYFLSQLMIFWQWQNEGELWDTFATHEQKYQMVKNIVDHNAQQFNQINKCLDNALNNFAIYGVLPECYGLR